MATSGEEERARLREEYKRELQLQKQMQQRAAEVQRMAKLQAELNKLEQMANSDDTSEWTQKLQQTAALAEAKLEMALGLTDPPQPDPTTSPEAPTAGATPAERSKTLGDDSTASTSQPPTAPPDDAGASRRKTLGDL